MKTIKTIHTALILMVLAFMTACSTDSADPIQGDSGGDNQGDKITVHMTLSTAPSSGTRASLSWNDGVDAENMKCWVVAFVKDNKVVSFAENKNVSEANRIKDKVTIKDLPKGEATYQVYSFANLTAEELGIDKGKAVDFDTKQWTMNGNGFDVNATDCKGIPMSNKQEITVDASGKTDNTDLWVVRMLAKITLKFRNPSATPLVINDITLNDVTSNPSATANTDGNIMLLPKHSYVSGTSGATGSSNLTGADKDQVKCIPNLVRQAATENYTYKLTKTIPAKVDKYETENEISFYVNESAAGNTSKYFIINLNTSAGVKRYALFKDWTTIARNDHHILPISLDDYKLKFDVQSFTAIGLYPSITDNGTTLSYTCYYPEEEFHIQPKVVKGDDTDVSGTIDYNNVKWELIPEGMADAAAAETNAKLVFKTLPSWNTTTGYFEGIFNDDKADKQSALYQVTVPVPGVAGKELIYKILFTKDLKSYAARKHTRQSYYFRTKQ